MRLLSLWLTALAVLAVSATVGAAQSDDVEPPTDLRFGGGELVWTDQSDNEDGFRIVAQAFNGERVERVYTVGANVTEFVLPAEVLPRCVERPSVRYSVSAFRGDNESESVEVGVIGECVPYVTPAPPTAVPDALPSTGSGADRGLSTGVLIAAATAFIATFVAAIAFEWSRAERPR